MNLLRGVCIAAITASIAGAQILDGATNQIVQVPEGWGRSDIGSGTILTPNSAPPGSVTVVLQGVPPGDTLRGGFDREVMKLIEGERVLNTGQVQTFRGQDGVEMLATTIEVERANGSHQYRFYLGAATPGSLEMLGYFANSPQSFQRYTTDVKQLIATRRFANLHTSSAVAGAGPSGPGAPLSPPPDSMSRPNPLPDPGGPAGSAVANATGGLSSNRLEGVYSGFKFMFTTTLGVMQKSAQTDYFTFFPDGAVFNGLPDHGVAGFNMARACAQGRQDFCGVYRLNGDQITIVLNRGTYTQVGVRTAGGFNINGRDYLLQGDPAKTPTHALEGVFVRADARPGEDLARRFVQFTRDGRFQDQGLVTTIAGTDLTGGNLHFERERGVGTYRLANYTLILRYSDGYERGLPIVIRPQDQDQGTQQAIFVNTYTLVRQQ